MWEEKIYECEGFEMRDGILKKTNFQIHQTLKRELHYILYGKIISTHFHYDIEQSPQIITNLEEIKHLKWIGECGNNFQKVGLWTALWKGEKLIKFGGLYSQDGKKEGKWKQTFKNYNDKAKVYEIGQYKENKKIGTWKYLHKDKEIGGGSYNIQGQKVGIWIELCDTFCDENLVTFHGQYQNDKKQGDWKICLVERGIIGFNFQKIGGGYYQVLDGESMKTGTWIELCDRFKLDSQIFQYGEYDTNGNKVGKWDIYEKCSKIYKWLGSKDYDAQNSQNKELQLDKFFDFFSYTQSDLYYNGQTKNCKKIGKWEILYRNWRKADLQIIQRSHCSGGGSYNQEAVQQKIGRWAELFEGFQFYAQVTFNGEYNIKGKKVGRWDIIYDKLGYGDFKQIGGGLYDSVGDQKKIGKWVELDNGFQYSKQVTFNGEYNQNGMKVGRWDIIYHNSSQNEEYKQIGGGSYHEDGSQKKIGFWLELFEGFDQYNQITYNGEYNMMGKKVGRWDIMFDQRTDGVYKQIGGGQFDQCGDEKKIGRWIELFEEQFSHAKVIYDGEYSLMGKKIGRWDIMYDEMRNGEYKLIGGGSYDQVGDQKKIGKWIELGQRFEKNMQFTYNGEYNIMGKKVGRWDIMCDEMGNGEQNLMQYFSGGGSYDQVGDQKKIGKWVELDQGFEKNLQVTYNGQYNMRGRKFNKWDIMFREVDNYQFEQIGGGSYDQDGGEKKIGKWIELHENFSTMYKITYNGSYNLEGIKIGLWVEMDLGQNKKLKETNYDY